MLPCASKDRCAIRSRWAGCLRSPRAARAQGRRVLLGGLFGNSTISWNGWSQTIDHLLAGRLITAFRQWRLYYRCSPDSPLVRLSPTHRGAATHGPTGRTRPRDGVAPRPGAITPRSAPILPPPWELKHAREGTGTTFFTASGRENGPTALRPPTMWATGSRRKRRSPASSCAIRPPTSMLCRFALVCRREQYLVEDIDRSLIRRAMWGLLPEAVLTNRQSGVHSADWYEKLSRRRDWLAGQLTELSASPLARRAIDFPRLERAIKNWPARRRAHVPSGGRISARAAASLCGRAVLELVRVQLIADCA